MRRRLFNRLAIVVSVAMVTAVASSVTGATADSTGGTATTYMVVFRSATSPSNAGATISAAGGTVVKNYAQIGVAVVSSSSSAFATKLSRNASVSGVSATAQFATRLQDDSAADGGPPPGDLPNSPASDSDSLSGLQWDMTQIHAQEAHAIT
ncbi:MAG TPA: hypothetical protein VNN79_20080, partial [Actinomycetota bacterium]|nr:hypothetical protein [Actinomycetota bacterium]